MSPAVENGVRHGGDAGLVGEDEEMVAADHWFNLDGAGSEADLIKRYEDALQHLSERTDRVSKNADALARGSWAAASVDQHFVGDWIHYRYYQNPRSTASAISGR